MLPAYITLFKKEKKRLVCWRKLNYNNFEYFNLFLKFLGILVIEEVDESGKWIDNARKAANELRNSQKPHLIIALLKSGAIQVSVQ